MIQSNIKNINSSITYDDKIYRDAVIKCRKDLFNETYQYMSDVFIIDPLTNKKHILIPGDYAIDLVCFQYSDGLRFGEVERCGGTTKSTKHYTNPDIDKDINIIAGDNCSIDKFEKYFLEKGLYYHNNNTWIAYISADCQNIVFISGEDINKSHSDKFYSDTARCNFVSVKKNCGLFCKLNNESNKWEFV